MEEVGCAEGEVGEELEIADAVGAELKVAGWGVVFSCGLAFQGGEIGCLNSAR